MCTVTVCVLWGYSMAFATRNVFFGDFSIFMLKGIELKSQSGFSYQLIHVAVQASFSCIIAALMVSAIAESICFSALIIFAPV
ncbi:MAG: hypothetical protein ACSLEL_03775 [Candidatus Malihini olakiniferum]